MKADTTTTTMRSRASTPMAHRIINGIAVASWIVLMEWYIIALFLPGASTVDPAAWYPGTGFAGWAKILLTAAVALYVSAAIRANYTDQLSTKISLLIAGATAGLFVLSLPFVPGIARDILRFIAQ
jgi:hypothetical protein